MVCRKTQSIDQTLTILLLGHPDIGVVTQAGLAENREVGVFPVRPIVRVGRQGHRHLGGLELGLFQMLKSRLRSEKRNAFISRIPSSVMIQR